jgi:hypothetical protein
MWHIAPNSDVNCSYDTVPTGGQNSALIVAFNKLETHMYIGGGILGTLLIVALIFFLLRRS